MNKTLVGQCQIKADVGREKFDACFVPHNSHPTHSQPITALTQCAPPKRSSISLQSELPDLRPYPLNPTQSLHLPRHPHMTD